MRLPKRQGSTSGRCATWMDEVEQALLDAYVLASTEHIKTLYPKKLKMMWRKWRNDEKWDAWDAYLNYSYLGPKT